ncbi:MAG: phosphoribosyltransferase family protein [Victivallaceae bacterium]
MLKHVLNIVLDSSCSFPCPGCRKEVTAEARNVFCPDCRTRMKPILPPRCPGCGSELDGVLELCSKCMEFEKRPWDGAFALFNLHGPGQQLIHRFKYNNTPELARAFGGMAAEIIAERGVKIDVIVPVPLHWTRTFMRGYNQSMLVCGIISVRLGIPCRSLLSRRRRTRQQAKLNRQQRLENLSGAFALKKGVDCRKLSVLLVDDVFTTGTTLAAAAAVLREAGPEKLYVLSLGRR